jgi:DNA-binding response OmpR family regulator
MTRRRIVIVNNERAISMSIRLALEDAGFDVETFERGSAALEPLRANPPDVILLDQTNTPMGTELFARLNEPWIAPVIFVTPHAEEVQRTLGRRGTPAADYIASPFSLRELVQRIVNITL